MEKIELESEILTRLYHGECIMFIYEAMFEILNEFKQRVKNYCINGNRDEADLNRAEIERLAFNFLSDKYNKW